MLKARKVENSISNTPTPTLKSLSRFCYTGDNTSPRPSPSMSFNTFGRVLRFTSWGESHGVSMGCILDGIPPRISLSTEDLQREVERRRSGLSRFTSQRKEPDQVQILSGVFEGRTTGAPVALQILNVDAKSKDYAEIARLYRPGHADYATQQKYGVRDWRGGGRASARETVMRVAAGAIAKKILGKKVVVRAAVSQIGPLAVHDEQWDWTHGTPETLFCPDREMLPRWQALLDQARKDGTSLGGRIEAQARGVPAGWGAPLYAKLDADLAAALMGINAVKGVEVGAGFAVVSRDGRQNADEMAVAEKHTDNNAVNFLANNAGGILGGISTGQEIRLSLAVKPTSSVRLPLRTVGADDKGGVKEGMIETKGRHDPCIAIRAVPVVEAMIALVLADHQLLHRAQCG